MGKGQFQFNFPVNEIENLKIEKSDDNTAHDGNTNDTSVPSETESTNLNLNPNSNQTENTSTNKYKTADNSFRFNFSIE